MHDVSDIKWNLLPLSSLLLVLLIPVAADVATNSTVEDL